MPRVKFVYGGSNGNLQETKSTTFLAASPSPLPPRKRIQSRKDRIQGKKVMSGIFQRDACAPKSSASKKPAFRYPQMSLSIFGKIIRSSALTDDYSYYIPPLLITRKLFENTSVFLRNDVAIASFLKYCINNRNIIVPAM